MQWYYQTALETAKGMVLVVHGLNLKPEKMSAIIAVLNEIGLDALLLSLKGHGEESGNLNTGQIARLRLKAFKKVTHRIWQDEVREGYKLCQQRAESLGCPIYFVGYSLGGLLGCNMVLSYRTPVFERMFLFAPAIATHRVRVPFFRLLYLFPGIVIPSLSPKNYRANRGTPVAAYLSLLEAVRGFKARLNSSLNIPSVVVIDRDDELVSYQKIKSLVKNHQLTQWLVHKIKRNPHRLKYPFHHLIIDQSSAGDSEWVAICELMIRHFTPEVV